MQGNHYLERYAGFDRLDYPLAPHRELRAASQVYHDTDSIEFKGAHIKILIHTYYIHFL
jgi:hypothetical protein